MQLNDHDKIMLEIALNAILSPVEKTKHYSLPEGKFLVVKTIFLESVYKELQKIHAKLEEERQ